MSKTKAQFRAEAVERLKMLDDNTVYYEQIADAVANNFACTSSCKLKKVLIDLLTDDEPQEQDTREKLESDITTYLLDKVATWSKTRYELNNEIIEWLDRQAAITTQECTDVYESGCEACRRAQKREIAELQAKVDALEAEKQCTTRELGRRVIENADLKKKVDELEEENRLMRERLRNMADNDVTVFGMKLDEVRNLQAKNAELREKLEADTNEQLQFNVLVKENTELREKLSQALDHAHSISKLGELD